MRFYNRVRELGFLNNKYHSNKFEMILIYGRRRIGKTYLLRKFVEDKTSVFFVANQQGASIQLPRLYGEVSRKLSGYKLAFNTINDFLQYLSDHLNKKMVLVLDEFQYLVEIMPELPSILKTWIEENWKNKDFTLILCGSIMGMMLNLVEISQPLYGLITGKLQIKPFSFLEVKNMFPNLGIDDVLRIYGVFGGSPAYLEYYDVTKSFRDNLFSSIFNYGHKLYDEPSNLIQSELPNNTVYFDILYAIATGKNKVSQIADFIKRDARNVPLFLSRLEKLGLITKSIPVSEKPKSKNTRYLLDDFFFRFWFQFKHFNETAIEEEDIEYLIMILDDTLDQYMGYVIETVVSQLIKSLNTSGLLPFKADPKKIGNWWNTTGTAIEIDTIALDRYKRNRNALFIETKWNQSVDFTTEINKLVDKIENSKFTEVENKWYGVIARGFSSKGGITLKHLIDSVEKQEIMDFLIEF